MHDHPDGWATRALVDTGSPLTVFDRGTADALNIRMGYAGHRKGEISLMGAVRHVQFEYVELSLPSMDDDAWTADVAFIKQADFQMPFQGILGAQGFLDRHLVTVNYYEGYFEIKRLT
jgi:hypothetical protein